VVAGGGSATGGAAWAAVAIITSKVQAAG
jgi:hypothetical protein